MSDKPWRNKELVNRLYHEEKMSGPEIADKFGCSNSAVYNQIEDARSISEANHNWRKKTLPKPKTTRDGYEQVRRRVDGEVKNFMLHRLIAVAEHGFDELKGKVVHHKNNIPWDNRPENLQLMAKSEHVREHKEEIHINKKMAMLEMAENTPATHETIADQLGKKKSTVSSIVARAKRES